MAKKKQNSNRARKQDRMFRLISQYEAGGLSRAEFSKAHGIPSSTFDYWLRKYRNRKVKAQVESPEFIPVKISSVSTGTDKIDREVEVIYPEGTVIRLSAEAGAQFIRSLLPHFQTDEE